MEKWYEEMYRRAKEQGVWDIDDEDDDTPTDPDPNYIHPSCGTTVYISDAHKMHEHAWCEEAEAVVAFERIENSVHF